MAYIGLGANLGDRAATLRVAAQRLGSLGEVAAVSSLYETAPIGYADQPPFLNAVLALRTALPPLALVPALLAIETAMGRVRTFRNAPRTLDLDLLLHGNLVTTDAAAQVPHPRLHERAFVLAPLAEIAPEIVHPRLGRTVQQLRDDLGPLEGIVVVDDPGWITRSASGAGTPGDR
ncbi:MAG: 2-amino-4-hydroxy-6-hydroxymethyldihydropteridine diphosphokinase [Thermomicrobiales bacterium]|nr:2-amino-4-hydroxy-6-hydroxymethyldihydropteridine diphosphokinase [Thermomicrobiales bacterium]